MELSIQAANMAAEVVRCGVVSQAKAEGDKTACRFKDGGSVFVSNFLAAHIRPGDEITFPLAIDSAHIGTELYLRKVSSSGGSSDLYQAPINYAGQPKTDKRERLYVRAEVSAGRLGISSVHLPCEVLRDYFYVANRHQPWDRQTSLYETLRITPTASLAEVRLAFKLRELELRAVGACGRDQAAIERAFNILGPPDLRVCYDSLLSDPLAPALFPYGGFGSVLVTGDRSHDGQTFFATRILSFLPERRERAFVRLYAGSTSTTIAPSTATFGGNWRSCSTKRPCRSFGTLPGTSGDICWVPRSNCKALSSKLASTVTGVASGS